MATGLGTPTAALFTSGALLCQTKPLNPAVVSISPSSGPASGGTAVVITGTNLTGATAVYFGTTKAADVKVVSSTQVTANTPAGPPGTVSMTVATSYGMSPPAGFVYVTANLPYVPLTPYRIADTRCGEIPKPPYCASEQLPSLNATLGPPTPPGQTQRTG
ncbi:Cell surface receptor IPT/TIG domain protein, partial [mine drainage metagenome]